MAVLVDVSKSYRAAIEKTTEHFAGEAVKKGEDFRD